jgi:hypothetical protein
LAADDAGDDLNDDWEDRFQFSVSSGIGRIPMRRPAEVLGAGGAANWVVSTARQAGRPLTK